VIALEGVAKAYATITGRRTVLDNATVAFAPGHNFGILGVNGVGKSTLIRLLAGSEMPDRGIIRRTARVSVLGRGGIFGGKRASGRMPHYMEPGARVGGRWSPGRAAKVVLQHPPRADRGPDDRRQNGAG
jgi:energy-coupling factor transporter ATP-binding protein EcfA2